MGPGSGRWWAAGLLALLVACGATEPEPDTLGHGACQSLTCAELGLDCGVTIDGCGGILRCGTCSEGEVCGGTGVPNVCGPPSCPPGTCGSLGKNCGTVPDGCGGTLDCGACPEGETCGGGGVANVCHRATSVCVDRDLGSALPVGVKGGTPHANDDHQAVTFLGDTVRSGDGFQGTGGARMQQDGAHLWTAPVSGTYVFDTVGSGYGNALYVLTRCRGGASSWRARRTRPRGRRARRW